MNRQLFDDSRLPLDLENRVHSELQDDERLLWVGQPILKRFARQAWPIVLFGIPWTAFAVFWMVAASGMLFGGFGNGGLGFVGLIFPLFGLPFVLIGLGMLSSPYWLKQRAGQTFYALTNRRAILWEAGWFGRTEVRSYSPDQLKKIRRVEYGNGDGDLIFEESLAYGRNSDGHRTTHVKRHGLMSINRVREVEELIRQALLSPTE